MCGIAGIFLNKEGNSNINISNILDKMASHIKNRGPDNTNKWISSDNFFGTVHTRLSIIGLGESGNQPMISQNSNSFICFNGEIYNTDFLKNKLSKKSYELRGSSDTEIILEYFLEFGIEDLSRSLEGMYGIFLYDSKNKEIFILRDRFGIKPLYFSNFKGNIIVASEIKSY